jgi:hypothetical protein
VWTPDASGPDVADGRRGVVGTDTQWTLRHVPDGASGTVARSIGARAGEGVALVAGGTVEVFIVARVEVGEPDADDDADADAESAMFRLPTGKNEGEPGAVDPTQPAAIKVVSATRAAHSRQRRRPTNLDSMACPSGRSSMLTRR